MINREINYQRNVTGSYMMIPVSRISNFDEKLILKQKLPGLVPVEKCFMNGRGEYWYQISGKQSLDTYTRIQKVGIDFIEKVILSICSEIEILESYLFDVNCLQLEPELVYVSNQTREILFCLYPDNQQSLSLSFQQLMEYLITRIDHSDDEAVRAGYDIYEKTLDESYNILDIREYIVELRKKKQRDPLEEMKGERMQAGDRREKLPGYDRREKLSGYDRREKLSGYDRREKLPGYDKKDRGLAYGGRESREEEDNEKITLSTKLNDLWENILLQFAEWKESILKSVEERLQIFKKSKKKEGKRREEWKERNEGKVWNERQRKSYYIDPEDPDPEPAFELHPTICIGRKGDSPEGIFLYEGSEDFPDLRVEKESYTVGKGKDVSMFLNRETVSRHHAKIIKDKDGIYLEDLNSTNGTYINEELLVYKEKHKLESNDIVRFADVKYRFI